MGLGLSGTCRFGRSGTRDSDYRERLIATKPRKSAWNHPPSNYANRKESFGFLLTHSDAGNRTCAGRRIVRWSEKPLGFLIFRSPELSAWPRSDEHTSELQSLMRTSSAVFCLK